MPSSPVSDHPHWLRRSGFFREIVGYSAAVDLLNDPRMHARFVEIFEGIGVTSGPVWESSSASLLSLNGEEHKRLRSLVAGRFTPRAVERLRPVAHTAAHDLIATFAPAGTCEFVSEFAEPYVMKSTSHFVGFHEDDVEACWQAVQVVGAAMKDLGNRIDDLDQGLILLSYAKSALEERRRHPTDDVLTLIADEVTRGSLPESVGLVLVSTLLSAGLEPTINQLGIMVAVLSRQPQIWDALGAGQLAATTVVEAVLRFRSTNQGAARCVAESFDYRGTHFEKGETVLIGLADANHDPDQFANADRLDLDAERGPHLAFGFGPHFCLGAALARLQLQEAIGALARRVTCPVVVDVRESEGGGLCGPSSLVVSFSERSAS